jgi:hypothetical protein
VRRSLLFALVGVAILSLPQVAQAHGSVVRNHADVGQDAPGVWGFYNYQTTNIHPRVCVRVTLQSRPGDGGTWVNLATRRNCNRKVKGIRLGTPPPFHPRNCSKDYRAIGTGVSYSATNRPHLKAADSSGILQNTC